MKEEKTTLEHFCSVLSFFIAERPLVSSNYSVLVKLTLEVATKRDYTHSYEDISLPRPRCIFTDEITLLYRHADSM